MRVFFSLLSLILLASHTAPSTTRALERHIHARAGGSSARCHPDYLGTEHKRPGFDHIGFEVEDLQVFKDDVELLAKHDPEFLAPKPANVESEYQVIMDLLRSCRYGKHQMCDPEGNLVDISVV